MSKTIPDVINSINEKKWVVKSGSGYLMGLEGRSPYLSSNHKNAEKYTVIEAIELIERLSEIGYHGAIEIYKEEVEP